MGDTGPCSEMVSGGLQRGRGAGLDPMHHSPGPGMWNMGPVLGLTRRLLLPCVGDPDPVLRCIVSGFFANAARFHSSGAYR